MRNKANHLVIIVAPLGQDAQVMASLLSIEGAQTRVYPGLEECPDQFPTEASALLVTEEAIQPTQLVRIMAALEAQPKWSELPVIVLVSGRADRQRAMQELISANSGNVTILERPMHAATLLNSVQVALRSRERQYEVRDLLQIQERNLCELECALAKVGQGEEAKAKLAAIVESSDDAVVSKNLDGIITSWNSGAERLFGYKASEAIGQSIAMLIPPDRFDEEPRILERIRRGERIEHYETIRRRKDGTLVEISLGISPIRDAGGKIVGASKIARDISQRKRAEEALRDSEERYRALANATASIIWSTNATGEFITPQEQWAAYTGQRWEQHRGFGWIDALHPDDRLPISELWENANRKRAEYFATGRLWNGPSNTYRRFEARSTPLFHADGSVREWIGMCVDVEEREADRDALRASDLRFRMFVSQVKEYAIFQLNRQGQVTTWNEGVERLLGWQEHEFIGLPPEALFTPEDVEAGIPTRELRESEQNETASNDRWMRKKDGTRFFCMGLTTRILDAGGQCVGFTKVMRDQTTLKLAADERAQLLNSERAARSEAERAARLKDEFLATVSHELRTPLNAVLGWTQLLRRTSMPDEKTLKDGLEIIERSAKSQGRLIEDLLDVSAMTAGKTRIEAKFVDLVSVIHAAIEVVRLAAETKNIVIERSFAPIAGPIKGDATRLQQIIWNLLSNAVKFTPREGKVIIRLEQMANEVLITISDTGKGIPQEFLPFAFDRFRQAEPTATRKYGGFGLGLAIVKHLTELHGGSVAVSSGGKDRGTTVVVRLPVAPAWIDCTEQSSLKSGSPAGISLSNVHVLVVDDDPDACQILKRMLEQNNATVSAANSADEAIEKLAHLEPDVLLCDIGMPDRSGYELMREIRTSPTRALAGLPAVAVTAFARPEDRAVALQAGFNEHVKKPIDEYELMTIIQSLVG